MLEIIFLTTMFTPVGLKSGSHTTLEKPGVARSPPPTPFLSLFYFLFFILFLKICLILRVFYVNFDFKL
jgi:hypothetical protein